MTAKIIVAGESVAGSLNGISQRTRRYDADVQRAIFKRQAELMRKYAGYKGIYQTIEMLSPAELQNIKRISKATQNMTRRTLKF